MNKFMLGIVVPENVYFPLSCQVGSIPRIDRLIGRLRVIVPTKSKSISPELLYSQYDKYEGTYLKAASLLEQNLFPS